MIARLVGTWKATDAYKSRIRGMLRRNCMNRSESGGATVEALVMRVEEQPLVDVNIDRTPYAVKVACTVWCGGKG